MNSGTPVIICEGFLFKKKHAISAPSTSVGRKIIDFLSGGRSNWVTRFFRLHGESLSYYRTSPEPGDSPAWSTAIADIASITRISEGPKFVFCIVVPSRELYLQAKSRQDFLRWVTILGLHSKMRRSMPRMSIFDTPPSVSGIYRQTTQHGAGVHLQGSRHQDQRPTEAIAPSAQQLDASIARNMDGMHIRYYLKDFHRSGIFLFSYILQFLRFKWIRTATEAIAS